MWTITQDSGRTPTPGPSVLLPSAAVASTSRLSPPGPTLSSNAAHWHPTAEDNTDATPTLDLSTTGDHAHYVSTVIPQPSLDPSIPTHTADLDTSSASEAVLAADSVDLAQGSLPHTGAAVLNTNTLDSPPAQDSQIYESLSASLCEPQTSSFAGLESTSTIRSPPPAAPGTVASPALSSISTIAPPDDGTMLPSAVISPTPKASVATAIPTTTSRPLLIRQSPTPGTDTYGDSRRRDSFLLAATTLPCAGASSSANPGLKTGDSRPDNRGYVHVVSTHCGPSFRTFC